MIRFIVIAYQCRNGGKRRVSTTRLSDGVDIEKYAKTLSCDEDLVEVYDITLDVWNKYVWGCSQIGNYEYK